MDRYQPRLQINLLRDSAPPADGKYHIRFLRPEEAARAALLVEKAIRDNLALIPDARSHIVGFYRESDLRNMLRLDPSTILVAVLHEEILGFLIRSAEGGVLTHEWVGVHPAWRRRGIRDALVQHSEDLAREAGMHKVVSDCVVGHTASTRALERSGYRPIATLRDHWYGQDFVLWEKTL